MTARVRLADLPLAVRKQVERQLDTKPRRSRGSAGTVRGGSWVCSKCGATLTAWAPRRRRVARSRVNRPISPTQASDGARAEKHAGAHGGARLDCVLDEGRTTR